MFPYDPLVMEVTGRALGPDHWLLRSDDRTVVFQGARPGQGMTYSRTGWHTDYQSRPTSDIWPAVAVTVHLDATSPANGLLRVLPGSHRMTTDAMPLGFEKVLNEIALTATAEMSCFITAISGIAPPERRRMPPAVSVAISADR